MNLASRLLWANFLKVSQSAGFQKIILEEHRYFIAGKELLRSHLTAADPFRKLLLHAYSERSDPRKWLEGGRVYGTMQYDLKGLQQARKYITALERIDGATAFFTVELNADFWDNLAALNDLVTFVPWPRQTRTPNLLEPDSTDPRLVRQAWLLFLDRAPRRVRAFIK